MENRSDYEKSLGEKLEAAYMLEEVDSVMSREEFHRLIRAAERKKKRRKTVLSVAAASVALCLVCGGFVVGMTMGESAGADKDHETKTVQQGDSVVIGSGVSDTDRNVGVTTKIYTKIEDIPEDVRKEIRFLSSDEFELEKVKVTSKEGIRIFYMLYKGERQEKIEITEQKITKENSLILLDKKERRWDYKGVTIYDKLDTKGRWIYFKIDSLEYSIFTTASEDIKLEAILEGLIV